MALRVSTSPSTVEYLTQFGANFTDYFDWECLAGAQVPEINGQEPYLYIYIHISTTSQAPSPAIIFTLAFVSILHSRVNEFLRVPSRRGSVI